jgi:dihydroorotase
MRKDQQMPRYDTLISGGEVIDPGARLAGRYDLAIAGGRIAAVAESIDAADAARVIDARGQIVTPGLVDLHTHIYWGATFWGIEPDPVAARTGVTTWLDVGSAGAYSFPGFREFIYGPSRARIFCLLNISSIGLIAPTWELSNLDYCDVDLALQIIEGNRDVVLGVKARIDNNTTRGTGIRPLELARACADRAGLPLMVHIGNGPPLLDEVVALLRPGDILTHCFTGGTHRIVDERGRIHPQIRELQQAGLILDIGHGGGSFSYDVAEAAMAGGVRPDVISSDIHQLSIQGPMYDLPTTLSKFLNLGMPLPEVIDCATRRPALAMRRPDLGVLTPGAVADVAIFRLEEGEYTFHDVLMTSRRGSVRLVNTCTILGGDELPRLPERPLHVWAVRPPHQR